MNNKLAQGYFSYRLIGRGCSVVPVFFTVTTQTARGQYTPVSPHSVGDILAVGTPAGRRRRDGSRSLHSRRPAQGLGDDGDESNYF